MNTDRESGMAVHRLLDDELERLQSVLLEMADAVDEHRWPCRRCSIAMWSRSSASCGETMRSMRPRSTTSVSGSSPASNQRTLRLLITAIKITTGIERIGDHVKNIAERIVFPIEGQDIRHRGLQQEEVSSGQGK